MSKEAQYDLEVLVELRVRQRQEAETAYADALSAYHQAGQEVRAREEELRSCVERRRRECRRFDDEMAGRAQSMARIHEFDRYVLGMRDDESRAQHKIDEARESQQRAQRRMRKSHDQMLEAIKALKAVEKHYENWQKEVATTERRRQASTMDDVAARMWREQQL